MKGLLVFLFLFILVLGSLQQSTLFLLFFDSGMQVRNAFGMRLGGGGVVGGCLVRKKTLEFSRALRTTKHTHVADKNCRPKLLKPLVIFGDSQETPKIFMLKVLLFYVFC